MRAQFSRGWWSILLAVLVLFAGCGATAANGPTGQHSALATSTSTVFPARATPVSVLGWREVRLPAQVTAHQITGFAVSPVDGRDAWLCVQISSTSLHVWATRDFGVTWGDLGTLPPVTSEQSMCEIVADETNSRSLAAIVSWGSGEAGTLRSASLVSTDGGAHWSRISGDMQLMAMGSQGAMTYAILHDTASPLSSQPISLVASADGLHTWRSVGPPQLSANDSIFAFWLRPASTELIAASTQNTLWRSTDSGAHWTRINSPNTQTDLGVWLSTQAQWMLCNATGSPIRIACSTDLGKTWPSRAGVTNCFADALLPSGTLLAACPPNGGDGTQTATLYELPLGASIWTTLGALPEPDLFAATAAGQIWCGSLEAGALEVATLPS